MCRLARLCVVRGGGDLATGVAWRLTRAGFPVIVTELPEPLTVRRAVALSTAVDDGVIDIEGMIGRRVDGLDEAVAVAGAGEVAVVISPGLPTVDAAVVVDARLAKRNIDTTREDADLVVALGCGIHLNLLSFGAWVLLPIASDASGAYATPTINLSCNHPVAGGALALQAAFAPVPGPLGFELTNGLLETLGY